MNISPELDARFRAAAFAEGLVDVRYDLSTHRSAELLVAATDRGLCRISTSPERPRRTSWPHLRPCASCGCRSTTFAASSTSTSRARGTTFDLPLDLRVAPFHDEVLHELARVPYGRTTTYGALAAKVGQPRQRARSAR